MSSVKSLCQCCLLVKEHCQSLITERGEEGCTYTLPLQNPFYPYRFSLATDCHLLGNGLSMRVGSCQHAISHAACDKRLVTLAVRVWIKKAWGCPCTASGGASEGRREGGKAEGVQLEPLACKVPKGMTSTLGWSGGGAKYNVRHQLADHMLQALMGCSCPERCEPNSQTWQEEESSNANRCSSPGFTWEG